jgi:hypothetical protein
MQFPRRRARAGPQGRVATGRRPQRSSTLRESGEPRSRLRPSLPHTRPAGGAAVPDGPRARGRGGARPDDPRRRDGAARNGRGSGRCRSTSTGRSRPCAAISASRPSVANALFIISRVPGLAAHAEEETRCGRSTRAITSDRSAANGGSSTFQRYDGPRCGARPRRRQIPSRHPRVRRRSGSRGASPSRHNLHETREREMQEPDRQHSCDTTLLLDTRLALVASGAPLADGDALLVSNSSSRRKSPAAAKRVRQSTTCAPNEDGRGRSVWPICCGPGQRNCA